MASKAMAARLAAKMNAEAGDAPATEGDVPAGMGGDESDTSAVETVSEDVGAAPPRAADKGASGAASTAETPEQAEAKVRARRQELYEQKLADRRAKVQSARLVAQAKADRKAAAEDRKAGAAERGKWEKIGKEGTYLDGLKELGRDPRAEWEAMNKEAIEAGTPEAIAKREREALKREMDEKLTPLQREVEQLRAERDATAAKNAADAHASYLTSSFKEAAADPAFKDLRVEYADDTLLDHAKHYDKNPDQLRAHAREYGVRLTQPEKGFTMHELLQVLSAAQAAHNAGVQARRAAQSPAEPQSANPPTVNGTAPRRNAGTAIGNDLASQRASTGPAVSAMLSPQERLRQRKEAEIRRSGG